MAKDAKKNTLYLAGNFTKDKYYYAKLMDGRSVISLGLWNKDKE